MPEALTLPSDTIALSNRIAKEKADQIFSLWCLV